MQTIHKYFKLFQKRFYIYLFLCAISVFTTSTSYSQNPKNISNLLLWLASDSGVVLNGNNVEGWLDKSGNANNAQQITTNQQPILIPNGLNNKPAISFNGGQLLSGTSLNSLSSSSLTIFVVASGNPMSDSYNVLLDIGPFSAGGLWLSKNSENFTIYSNNAVYSSSTNHLSNSGFVPTIFNLRKQFNTSSESFENTILSANSTSAAFVNSFVAGDYSIGGDPTYFGRWNGNVFEVIIYNKALSDSENVIVNNYLVSKYAPPIDLGPDTVICYTPYLINAQHDYLTNYEWQDNSTLPNFNVSTPGKIVLQTTNVFNIQHKDSVNIDIKSPPLFNLGNDTIVCHDSQLIITSGYSDTLPYILNWFNGSNNDSIVPNQSGNYWLDITNFYHCTYSDSIYIVIDSSLAFTSLGPDTSLCSGNSISLINGNQPGVNYLWSDNSSNNSLTINASGQYWLTATNSNNCVAKDTINVTIVGQAPLAGFQNTLTCENTSVNFSDTSLAIGGATITNWFWNFGDAAATNDTAIVAQPNYTFSDTGSYTINLTVTTNAGCKQNLIKNIYIYPKPIVDFINVIACQNDTAFFNEVINSLGYPITNYQWDFGDGATSTSSDPFHIFSQNINYQVQLIATNSKGCVDTAIKTITVKDEVSADFNYSTACINVPISFTDNSIAPLPNTTSIRNWSFFPGTATGLNATKTFTSSGSHPVTLTVNGFNGCVSSITKLVIVSLPPDADFTSSTICIADSFQLTDASLPINGSINSWQWKFAGSTFSIAQNPKYLLNSSGNASVFLKVTNDSGCVDSITKIIFVNPLPDASFDINPSTYLFIDSPLSFTPNQASASSYFWNLSNGNTFSDPILTLSFTNEDTYTLGLLLTDNFGCKNNSSQTFTIARRMTDLGIIAARSTIDNDGFVGVEADLFNYGSTPVTEFEILYELTGGGIMKESWSADTIPPGAVLLFKFSAKSFLSVNERENAISCFTIQTVNTSIDDNLTNNENCAALNSNKQLVAEPFPNPADGDVSLPVVLTEDQTITITVYDYLGKLIAENITYDGVTGLNFIKIPCAAYSSGTYTLKISISDNNYIRKLIKQGSTK